MSGKQDWVKQMGVFHRVRGTFRFPLCIHHVCIDKVSLSLTNRIGPVDRLYENRTPVRIVRYIKKYNGNRILIVYGSDRVFKNGLMDEITDSIKKEGLTYEFLGGVVPNPHLSKVYEGVELGKRIQADFLLAVGGGSVIDTAKAVAYGLAEPEKDVWTLFAHTRTARK